MEDEDIKYLVTDKLSSKKHSNHIRIPKDSPYYSMSYRGYISKTRLAMAQHLGRCLGSDEYVYIIDGNEDNDSIDNLQLASHKELIKLNQLRSIDNAIDRLTSKRKAVESQLADIRFKNTPCNCPKCRRSLEARQRDYKLSNG